MLRDIIEEATRNEQLAISDQSALSRKIDNQDKWMAREINRLARCKYIMCANATVGFFGYVSYRLRPLPCPTLNQDTLTPKTGAACEESRDHGAHITFRCTTVLRNMARLIHADVSIVGKPTPKSTVGLKLNQVRRR